MTVVIHHNPDCGTSRNVLEIIKMTGNQPVVIEYLNDGWTKPQLIALFAAANLSPRKALRTSKSPAEELGLTDPSVSDDEIMEKMLTHPVLVNRPIVCTPKGVRLCRPSEAVFELLDVASGTEFVKEDGEKVVVP
ncbi:arsenate reductase [Cohaesibacter sp. ES.047]|uniref:arsenate reductase (glutaredoxin) n=1 Tax=Cohaesibacter sp. ES.047 TaxID=1798205 RepID=UPI000BB7E0D1|nr:arsenate reductase (glutaredoxin) [Cohaesibacter sp. ES.047]SNY90325.1 arsenate reductase [Cohaesibacter sp. ES.047]